MVGPAEEIKPGQRRLVIPFRGRAGIGVFNVNGTFHALRNLCPHKSGPLCTGNVFGRIVAEAPPSGRPLVVDDYQVEREGEIIRCPWHGWEFDITNGRSVFNPHRLRVRSYEVTIEPEDEDPSIETFPVTVERGRVVVHV